MITFLKKLQRLKQELHKSPAGTRQTDGKNFVRFGEKRKKISQIIKDYFCLPFFILIILCAHLYDLLGEYVVDVGDPGYDGCEVLELGQCHGIVHSGRVASQLACLRHLRQFDLEEEGFLGAKTAAHISHITDSFTRFVLFFQSWFLNLFFDDL